MKTLGHTYQDNPQTAPAASIITMLLAGLLAWLGVPFKSRAAFEAYRDHCYRVRGSVAAAVRVHKTRAANKKTLAGWSGDDRLHWRRRIRAQSLTTHRSSQRKLGSQAKQGEIPNQVDERRGGWIGPYGRQCVDSCEQDNRLVKAPP